jgi:hypothetical protein
MIDRIPNTIMTNLLCGIPLTYSDMATSTGSIISGAHRLRIGRIAALETTTGFGIFAEPGRWSMLLDLV